MTRIFLKGLALAALVGLSALTLPATAEAGRGWGGHGWGGHGYYGGRGWRGGGWGGPGYWGAGLIGLGVGAAIGSALAAPVYAGSLRRRTASAAGGLCAGCRRIWSGALVVRMVRLLRPALPELQRPHRLFHGL